MNIAQSLQQLLTSSGISRSKLAREIGVHTSTVSNWLDGKEVKAENLSALCAYFGCSLDYLAGQTAQAEKAPSENGEGKHRAPSAETLKLLELLESREDIRYLAAASEKATPEHVKATAEMFDKMYGRHSEE